MKEKIKLNVPYYNQLGEATCVLASLIMMESYFSKRRPSRVWEKELGTKIKNV